MKGNNPRNPIVSWTPSTRHVSPVRDPLTGKFTIGEPGVKYVMTAAIGVPENAQKGPAEPPSPQDGILRMAAAAAKRARKCAKRLGVKL